MFHRDHHKQHAKIQDWTSLSPQLRGLSHPLLLGDSSDSMFSDCQDENPAFTLREEHAIEERSLARNSEARLSSRLGMSGQAAHVLALEQFCYFWDPRPSVSMVGAHESSDGNSYTKMLKLTNFR